LLITSLISTLLGIGLLKKNRYAIIFLIFFSGYIILSKILIYTGFMHFLGQSILPFKSLYVDFVSLIYHAVVIFILRKKVVIF
jgi:hypothetical protein